MWFLAEIATETGLSKAYLLQSCKKYKIEVRNFYGYDGILNSVGVGKFLGYGISDNNFEKLIKYLKICILTKQNAR
jgi:hypothetical protein